MSQEQGSIMDTIIVGGSAAGLTAALYLGRSRRRVLLYDTGQPCNRFSHASHGFLTRDDVPPSELVAIGREQLARYATIRLEEGEVTAITPAIGHFNVQLADGRVQAARKVLLATGLRDELPPLPGIEHLWGRSVFHCPYCDGWEQRDQPMAIYGNGEDALHLARLLRNLTPDVVICTGGPATLSEQQQARLLAHGVRIVETPIVRLVGEGDQLREIVFADGTVLARQALFIRPNSVQSTPLPAQLGCALDEWGLVQVDEIGRTSVPGIYAAGDMAHRMRQVVRAVMTGAMAGSGINYDLVVEDFA